MGTGGNNVPLVGESYTLKVRGGKEGGGKGALVQTEKSATLSCNNDQTLFQKAYGICSYDSNSMKSSNPHSGIYEADTTRTLDLNGGNPSCNQGGTVVVFRKQRRAQSSDDYETWTDDGIANTLNTFDNSDVRSTTICVDMGGGKSQSGVSEEVSPTLTCTHGGAPAVAYGWYPQQKAEGIAFLKEKANCLVNGTNPGYHNGVCAYGCDFRNDRICEVNGTMQAKPNGGFSCQYNQTVLENKTEQTYIVRRLTPTECARLQGFPDLWCSDLDTKKPTEDDIAFWRNVFDTHADVFGKKKKTEKQVIKWLKNPYSESDEYKMWGNGVALPCVVYVLAGVKWNEERRKLGGKQNESSDI